MVTDPIKPNDDTSQPDALQRARMVERGELPSGSVVLAVTGPDSMASPEPGPITDADPGSVPAASLLALSRLDVDPVTGLIAAADVREAQALAALALGTDWHVAPDGYDDLTLWATKPEGAGPPYPVVRGSRLGGRWQTILGHIAAEADPAHALAEVTLWRDIAERHRIDFAAPTWPRLCVACRLPAPCPELLAAVAAARAYLGGQR